MNTTLIRNMSRFGLAAGVALSTKTLNSTVMADNQSIKKPNFEMPNFENLYFPTKFDDCVKSRIQIQDYVHEPRDEQQVDKKSLNKGGFYLRPLNAQYPAKLMLDKRTDLTQKLSFAAGQNDKTFDAIFGRKVVLEALKDFAEKINRELNIGYVPLEGFKEEKGGRPSDATIAKEGINKLRVVCGFMDESDFSKAKISYFSSGTDFLKTMILFGKDQAKHAGGYQHVGRNPQYSAYDGFADAMETNPVIIHRKEDGSMDYSELETLKSGTKVGYTICPSGNPDGQKLTPEIIARDITAIKEKIGPEGKVIITIDDPYQTLGMESGGKSFNVSELKTLLESENLESGKDFSLNMVLSLAKLFSDCGATKGAAVMCLDDQLDEAQKLMFHSMTLGPNQMVMSLFSAIGRLDENEVVAGIETVSKFYRDNEALLRQSVEPFTTVSMDSDRLEVGMFMLLNLSHTDGSPIYSKSFTDWAAKYGKIELEETNDAGQKQTVGLALTPQGDCKLRIPLGNKREDYVSLGKYVDTLINDYEVYESGK
jgi:aspartate/methionine/tyrosine aminotransferase